MYTSNNSLNFEYLKKIVTPQILYFGIGISLVKLAAKFKLFYSMFYQEHQDMLPPDLTSVDVERAAIKIQQVYRGFQVHIRF